MTIALNYTAENQKIFYSDPLPYFKPNPNNSNTCARTNTHIHTHTLTTQNEKYTLMLISQGIPLIFCLVHSVYD